VTAAVTHLQRLAPPPDMPLEQAKIWNRIVASMPAGFFNQPNAESRLKQNDNTAWAFPPSKRAF
jgi:hypothetical protein